MKEFFQNKDYLYLYFSTFFLKIWKAIFSIMWAVLLYKNWYEIWHILMLIWISFWFMWLITPFSNIISNKIWIFKTVVLANIFQSITVYLLLFLWTDLSVLYVVFLWIISSISGWIMHPIDMFLKSHIVIDWTRWKFNSTYHIFSFLWKLLSVIMVWYFTIVSKEWILFLIILFLNIIWVLLYYLLLKGKNFIINAHSVKRIYSEYLSKKYSTLRTCFSLEWFIVIEIILIPLFILIYVWDFQKTTFFIGVSMLINFIFLLLFGKYIDKFAKKSIFLSASTKCFSSLWFIFYTFFPFWILFYDFISKVSESMWFTSFYSDIQKKFKSSNDVMLSACLKEMSICFSELIALSSMTIIAYFIGEKILFLIFILWWIAPILIYKIWKH